MAPSAAKETCLDTSKNESAQVKCGKNGPRLCQVRRFSSPSSRIKVTCNLSSDGFLQHQLVSACCTWFRGLSGANLAQPLAQSASHMTETPE